MVLQDVDLRLLKVRIKAEECSVDSIIEIV
jgi:hypothetical protein